MKKRVTILLLLIVFLLSGCGSQTSIQSLKEMEPLELAYLEREEEIPMGQRGWTILIYLCGSDLESVNGFATMNLQELMGIPYGEELTVVVQTGGADTWHLNEVDAERMQRFVVKEGALQLVDEANIVANMGAENTLYEFLSWGVSNYPAEKIGVIFWNHGGGSIEGFAYDELFYGDSLTLREMANAFDRVNDEMTDKFEFVGFDTCLMAPLEAASLLMPHARYMIASEDTALGRGWDYEDWAAFLNESPEADGAQLGQVICDGYYRKSEDYYEASIATLSVVDLAEIEDVLYAFHDFSYAISVAAEDKTALTEMARGIAKAENFGGNSYREGYSNLVDLGDMAQQLLPVVGQSAQTLIDELDEAVVYAISGDIYENATGLTVYYPLKRDNSRELAVFIDIAASPYYAYYVEEVAGKGGTVGGGAGFLEYLFDVVERQWERLFSIWGGYETSYGTDEIAMAVEPHIDEEGYYVMQIAESSLPEVQQICFSLYKDEGQEAVYLGSGCDVYVEWENGYAADNFYGTWPLLGDGQYLCTYLVDEKAAFAIYSVPVLLNDTESFIRVKWYWQTQEYAVVGAWEGIDAETGKPGKEIAVKAGDKIVPIYDVVDFESGQESVIYGKAYYVPEGGLEITEGPLEEGDYYYCFEIVNIYGESYFTDYAVFYIDEEGGVSYYSEK